MQLDLGLHSSSNPKFQSVLDYIGEVSSTPSKKGELFERLMQQYFTIDPIYQERFSEVYRWKEWAALRGHSAQDLGIDLVAVERDGGYCAIQCKCYAPTTRITKPDIDSFISESNRPHFTSRIIVDTGASWGQNAIEAIKGITPECKVIRFSDLERSRINWVDLQVDLPEQISRREPFELKPHQKDAFDGVITEFETNDRGKMIMACGTGKTFTALRIAEYIAGIGGQVLYLVPSIALISQAMREWAEQKKIPHSYLCICSDTTAGRHNEDVSIAELEIPVTTDPVDISIQLKKGIHPDKMNVVFCTYHSLPIIETAQNYDAPAFDIIFCDEAHRTTGIQHPGQDVTHFRLVHDGSRIKSEKRLYMTATPKLYTEGIRTQAASQGIDVYSMDDEETYGSVFYYLPFSKAVEIGELSDYKVVIIAISESDTDAALQSFYQSGGVEISITDATKIVGCWRALQNPERKPEGDETIKPIKSAIAFTNRIADSKRIRDHWEGIINKATESMPEESLPTNFNCQVDHVDGKVNAFLRKEKLEWLRYPQQNECRILSNARCLSEGVDVPALDAVLFMAPRQSHVDIVQAVGRVMRKPSEDVTKTGYIILPVAIPEGVDPADALDNNERFTTVWRVLRALRSHDDRFNDEINRIDLNTQRPDRIIFDVDAGVGGSEAEETQPLQLSLFSLSFPADKMYAQIVERCGDRIYLERWAKDVADIFIRLSARIGNLIENPQNTVLKQEFGKFHKELQATINESITANNAIDMIAQHILTNPIFEALFEDYDFTQHNPVARALQELHTEFEGYGLENETRDLAGLYQSVQRRARGIDNSKGRQTVLIELYNKFFSKALKKEADRLGIVYTPIELVDFVLHSVNDVLFEEFDRTLSNTDVHVLDPFTGTGTFIARLLQSDLINPDDLLRKYKEELHANEIILLAYYIATVNIEEVFRGQRGEDTAYEPFKGIVLTDTFNLNELSLFPKSRMANNNKRLEHQEDLPIEVIIGNPPWSAGQRNAADDNPNVSYDALEERIRTTYAAYSDTTLVRHLYNLYKMAFRWASDRIEDRDPKQGIVAFVTPASWIDRSTSQGFRAYLPKEFSSIYVLNLLGDARIRGELGHLQGEGVFGSNTQSPVAITILAKNPNAKHDNCQIYYREIGTSLTRKEKLEKLQEAKSIKGFRDWQTITPDRHHDWIDQRSEIFETFYPMGTKEAKAGRADNAIFHLYSLGISTNRDAHVYNFCRKTLSKNAEQMTQEYLTAVAELEQNPQLDIDEVVKRHSKHNKWTPELKKKLERLVKTEFDENHIRKVLYRPFVATNCCADYTFITRKGQMDKIFPNSDSENRVICVTGTGAQTGFSALMTNRMSDLEMVSKAKCFPRWSYHRRNDTIELADNISDRALCAFQNHYRDSTITKNTIFDYIYGILHAPNYREEFASDLQKEIPRIPYVDDFHTFTDAGAALASLHLNYETCEQYPNLIVEPVHHTLFWEEKPEYFKLDNRGMKFIDEAKTILKINEHVCVTGIPEEAHRYFINGYTPLWWLMNRYKITPPEKNSGILNDANEWFENPRDLKQLGVSCMSAWNR